MQLGRAAPVSADGSTSDRGGSLRRLGLAATRQALEDFVARGGGFVSVHAANNSFPNWPAYNRMIG
ncbi:MAG: hypothetical protein ACKOUK_01785, partial [Verrucomicrobiota bacterium]